MPDQPIVHSRALRLCALGLLIQRGPQRYAELARDVRSFIAHFVGPAPEMMATSLELLRYDGLIETADDGASDSALLRITDSGRTAFIDMMAAALRVPGSELNRLMIALKLRFLYLLPADRQRQQLTALADLQRRDLARLEALRLQYADEPGLLAVWIEHDIAQSEQRLAWLHTLLQTA